MNSIITIKHQSCLTSKTYNQPKSPKITNFMFKQPPQKPRTRTLRVFLRCPNVSDPPSRFPVSVFSRVIHPAGCARRARSRCCSRWCFTSSTWIKMPGGVATAPLIKTRWWSKKEWELLGEVHGFCMMFH